MQQKSNLFIDALHIFVLFSFAFAQPLFDLLSRNAEFFVARHSEPVDVILLILILCVLLPVLVVLIEVVAGLFGRHARRGIHGFTVAVLVAIIVLPALSKIFKLPGTALLVGAAILGVTATIAYVRFHPVRIFLTVLSPALLIFPGLFLFNSPVFKVVFPQKDPSAISVKVDNPCPIIMVVFDEFPVTSLMDQHRQIDPIRYPNFAALARDAYWFRNATSLAAESMLVIPSMLTGNYPDPSRQPTAADYPNNIFTLLGGFYDLKVFEKITKLCPTQLCRDGINHGRLAERIDSLMTDLSVVYLHIILPPDLTIELPVITQGWKDFIKQGAEAKEVTKNIMLRKLKWNRSWQFSQFLHSIDSAIRPTLYFLHLLCPHRPWEYLPSGKKSNTSKLMGTVIVPKIGVIWDDDEWVVTQGYQLHLLQVGFVDKLLGQLMEKLKAVNLYDRSLIVVTADHGISFLQNEYLRVITKANSGDITFVPLFIKAPNQHEGVICDSKVETIDILPTIADVLGIQLSWAADGRSVLDKSLPERAGVLFINPRNEQFKFMLSSLLDLKHDTLKRKLTLFGSGTNPGGLFKIGPHKDLVGRSIRSIDMMEGNATVELHQGILYANVDPKAAFVPNQIAGRLFLNDNTVATLNLAISVNGKIRAVTRTFPLEGGIAKWSAMVPETAFRKGKNEVEVFVVSHLAGQLRLERARNHSIGTYSFSLKSEQNGEIINSSDGKSIPVIKKALRGHLDVFDVESGRVTFSGWAADVKKSQLPDAIVIFVNGKSLYSGHCNVDRRDLVKAFNNGALRGAGFKYHFPLSWFKDIDNCEVRIFAVSKGNIASELIYPRESKLGKKQSGLPISLLYIAKPRFKP